MACRGVKTFSDEPSSDFENSIYKALRSLKNSVPSGVRSFGESLGTLICAADPYSLGISAVGAGVRLFAKKTLEIYRKRRNWNEFKDRVLDERKTDKTAERLVKDVFEWKEEVQRHVLENNTVAEGIASYLQDSGLDERNVSEIAESIVENLGKLCLETKELLLHLMRQELGISHSFLVTQIESKLEFPSGFISLYEELDYQSYLIDLVNSCHRPVWFRRPHANWTDIAHGRIIDREEEIKHILDTLRNKNIQLVVGDSGAGKTTLAYLLGHRLLESSDIPFRPYNVYYIDITESGDGTAGHIDKLVRAFFQLKQESGIEACRMLLLIDNVHLMPAIAKQVFARYKCRVETASKSGDVDFVLFGRTTTNTAVDSSIDMMAEMGMDPSSTVSEIRSRLQEDGFFEGEFASALVLERQGSERVVSQITDTYLSVVDGDSDQDLREEVSNYVLQRSRGSLWLVSFVLRAIERIRSKIGKVAINSIDYDFCTEMKLYYGLIDEPFENTQIMKLESVYERISSDVRFRRIAHYLRSEQERRGALVLILYSLSIYSQLELPIPEAFLNEIVDPAELQPQRQPNRRISRHDADKLVNTLKILLKDSGEVVGLKRGGAEYLSLPHMTLAKHIVICFQDLLPGLQEPDSIVERVTQLFQYHLDEHLSINSLLESLILEPELAETAQIPILEAISNLDEDSRREVPTTLLKRLLFLNLSEEAVNLFRKCTGVQFIGFGIPVGGFDTLDVHNDGKLLAAGSLKSGEVYIFGTESGSYIDILLGLDNPSSAIAWHPRKPIVAAVSCSGRRVCIWNLLGSDTHSLPEIPDDKMDEKYLNISWSPNGDLLCVVCQHEMRLYDSISGNLIGTTRIVDTKLSEAFFKDALFIWKRGYPILLLKDRTSVRVYRNGKLSLLQKNRDVRSVYPRTSPCQGVYYSWSSKYQKLAVFSWEIQSIEKYSWSDEVTYKNTLSIWRLVDGELKKSGTWEVSADWRVYDIAWHPEGNRIVFVFRTCEKQYGVNVWAYEEELTPLCYWIVESGSFRITWKDIQEPLFLITRNSIKSSLPDGSVEFFGPTMTRPVLIDPEGNYVFYERIHRNSYESTLHYLNFDHNSESKRVSLEPIDTTRAYPVYRKFRGFSLEKNAVLLLGESRALLWDVSKEQSIDSFEYRKVADRADCYALTYRHDRLTILLFPIDMDRLMFLEWKNSSLGRGRPKHTSQYFTVMADTTHTRAIVGEVGPRYYILDLEDSEYEVPLPIGTELCEWGPNKSLIALLRKSTEQDSWVFEVISLDGAQIVSSYDTIFNAIMPNSRLKDHTQFDRIKFAFSPSGRYAGISCEKYQLGCRQGYHMHIWDTSKKKEIMGMEESYRLGPISWMDNTHFACAIGRRLSVSRVLEGDVEEIDSWEDLGPIELLEFTARGLVVYGHVGFYFIPLQYGG